jgi:hypothetical protein
MTPRSPRSWTTARTRASLAFSALAWVASCRAAPLRTQPGPTARAELLASTQQLDQRLLDQCCIRTSATALRCWTCGYEYAVGGGWSHPNSNSRRDLARSYLDRRIAPIAARSWLVQPIRFAWSNDHFSCIEGASSGCVQGSPANDPPYAFGCPTEDQQRDDRFWSFGQSTCHGPTFQSPERPWEAQGVQCRLSHQVLRCIAEAGLPGADVVLHMTDVDSFWASHELVIVRRTNGAWSSVLIDPRLAPVERPLGSSLDFVAVDVGIRHACALDRHRQLWCWGQNESGQLGLGHFDDRWTPQRVTGIADVRALGIVHRRSCVLDNAGRVFCWGDPSGAGLGTAIDGDQLLPRAVFVDGAASAVAVGWGHSCAIVGEQRNVMCWGHGTDGQLGDARLATPRWSDYPSAYRRAVVRSRAVARPVAGASGAEQLVADAGWSCTGQASQWRCWGGAIPRIPMDPSLAEDAVILSPALVAGAPESTEFAPRRTALRSAFAPLALRQSPAVSPLGNFACAVASDRSAMCVGSNRFGQLGNGSRADSSTPVRVVGVENVVEVAVGAGHACARTEAGAVFCWGNNIGGQCGSPDRFGHSIPRRVTIVDGADAGRAPGDAVSRG